jgi:hypothetical protein
MEVGNVSDSQRYRDAIIVQIGEQILEGGCDTIASSIGRRALIKTHNSGSMFKGR